MSDNYRTIRPECKEEFEKIHERIDRRDGRLNALSDKQQAQGESLARVSEDVIHVTKSIGSLTKALWGVAASMLATLFGFVLWYIQHI